MAINTLSASGEWLLPPSDIPTSGPIKVQMKRSKSTSVIEAHICYECSHTFKSCECKTCLKCGTPFMKYFGTNVMKGRSHCRVCASPVCVTCIVLIKGLEKVCTRCHLKQKEDEISTEKALSAICQAKFGLTTTDNSSITKLKTVQQRKEALFDAAKKGHDHVVVTLINLGCDVNSTDANENTALFYAAEAGYLPCVALLLEKGANIKVHNNVGWTSLHAVAWKGSSDSHVECAEFLIEMGADLYAESVTNETAADVAERCGDKKEISLILRAAEVEVAMAELDRKAKTLLENTTNHKEKRLARLIFSLLKHISKQPSTTTTPRKAFKNVPSIDTLPKTKSFDRDTSKHLCEKCKGPLTSPTKQKLVFTDGNTDNQRSIADVEPMKLKADYDKLLAQKEEWEERCRKLMSSIAISHKEHKKQIDDMENEIKRLTEEKQSDITKCEATYANKLTKVRQETEISLQEAEERLNEAEREREELLHLHKNYKLTWIPDDIILECEYTKCRAPFSKTNRKHHCRCCGRVFCANCSQQKTELPILGYTKPVRVCNTCYALVGDMFTT